MEIGEGSDDGWGMEMVVLSTGCKDEYLRRKWW